MASPLGTVSKVPVSKPILPQGRKVPFAPLLLTPRQKLELLALLSDKIERFKSDPVILSGEDSVSPSKRKMIAKKGSL